MNVGSFHLAIGNRDFTVFLLFQFVRKSKTLLFGKFDVNAISSLELNNEPIEFVPFWKYLGCTIVSGAKMSFSTSTELGAFYASSNSILRSMKKPNELVLINESFVFKLCAKFNVLR